MGTKWARYLLPPAVIIVQANPAITFNKICPAIMFANNRTDKEMKVIVNPNLSKATMNGIIGNGVPAGNNLPKIFLPWRRNPTLLFPIQTALALVIVTTKCEVTV